MKTSIPDSIIAIDGYSSCGKSTLAKDLAKQLNYRFIDSGAMYRACTLYFLDNNININKLEEVTQGLNQITIEFQLVKAKNTTFLNEINVESEIRSLRVSKLVSEVAAIKIVRLRMVSLQQAMGKSKKLVMDGRDIGSVVFPEAEHKFFITAQKKIRIHRRHLELNSKGQKTTVAEIEENLTHRDHIDSTRKESPLIQTDQHILIDNSYLDREEQVLIALKYMEQTVALSV